MTEEEITNRVYKFFLPYKLLHYKKGETIIRAEDQPSGVYLINSGYVRNYSLNEEGKELTLNIFKPGSYFPMTWVVADIPNTYYFEAISQVELRRAPKNDVLEKLLKAEPEVFYDLSRRILVGLGGILVRMQYLIFSDAAHKISSTMLLLARRFGEKEKNGRIVIKISLTHQDIANLAGLTRETASIEINKLEKKKLIARVGRFWVVNNINRLIEESTLYIDDQPLPYTF